MYIVYKITNKVNNKAYIGFTGRKLEKRWDSHKSHAKNGSIYRFHCAIRKYGEENFKIEELNVFKEKKDATDFEELLIEKEQTLVKGYNAKPGGCGGWVVKEENYADWYMKLKQQAQGENNPRYSGITDDDLLKTVRNMVEKEGFFSIRKANKYGPWLKSLSKFRFSDYKGTAGERLAKAYKQKYNEELPKYSKTKTHKRNIGKAVKGRHWYYNETLKENRQQHTSPGKDWKLGRKKWD